MLNHKGPLLKLTIKEPNYLCDLQGVWPTHPDLPKTFRVLALRVPHPRTSFRPRQMGTGCPPPPGLSLTPIPSSSLISSSCSRGLAAFRSSLLPPSPLTLRLSTQMSLPRARLLCPIPKPQAWWDPRYTLLQHTVSFSFTALVTVYTSVFVYD